jgi:hypothetical protein
MVVPFAVLVLGMYGAGTIAMDSPAPKIIFPQHYAGEATLLMSGPAARPGARVAGGWVFEFPSEGHLEISDGGLGPHRMPEFYRREASGALRPISRGSDAECQAVALDTMLAYSALRDAVCYSAYATSDPIRQVYRFFVLRTVDPTTP